MSVAIEPFQAIENRVAGPSGTVTILEDRSQAALGARMLNADESLREIVEAILKEIDGPIPVDAWEAFLNRWRG